MAYRKYPQGDIYSQELPKSIETGIEYYKVSECDHFVSYSGDGLSEIICDDSVADNIFINGFTVSKINNIDNLPELNSSEKSVIYVHFNNRNTTTIALKINNQYINITHNIGEVEQQGWDRCEKMIDCDTSFQLLRVNPKLTGNVKVVVDSKNDLYLDTFKVSKGLSQRKYRKIKINPEEFYGNSLMSKMSSLPSDDFYKIEDACYSLFSTVNNIGDEYYDTYNSGVRTNPDKLYSENYSLLAPLCVRKRLPDFFLIFKCKNIPEFTTNEDRLKYMIENGKVIKSYDMRQESNLGKYINNIYKHSKNFPGYMFVSYDYNGNNIYNGISLDRGIVASHYEATALERNIKNQVAMNDWYTLGFERNRVVAKDIINLEFMFDDPEEPLFSITNYFGLYVRLNGENREFSCIQETDSEFIFDSNIKGLDFNPEDNMTSIYGFSTPDSFNRINTNIKNNNTDNKISDYVLKPYKCIFTTDTFDYENNISFVSCEFTNLLNAGEHYRVIDNTEHKIYDVIISNYKSSYNTSEISYESLNINGTLYEIQHISIYNIDDLGYHDENCSIKEHINLLTEAFNKFDTELLHAYNDGENTFSITVSKLTNYSENTMELLFEKVLSHCGYNDYLIKENIINNDNCNIFGIEQTDEIDYIKLLPHIKNDITSLLYPKGFESLGERLCKCMSFIPSFVNNKKLYVFKNDPLDAISNYNSILYQDTKNNYHHTTSNEESNYIIKYVEGGNPIDNISSNYDFSDDFSSDFHISNDSNISISKVTGIPSIKCFGNTKTFARFFDNNNLPKTEDGKLRLYQNYPLNAGICSIFPVKDFDTNIYDIDSQFSLNSIDGNISVDGGTYITNNNITKTSILSSTEEYMCDYIDKSERYKSNKTLLLSRTSGSYSDYIKTLMDNNHTQSDVCIVVPSCCKWESIGTDHTGNFMRIMYPFIGSKYTELTSSNKSYYIPTDTSTCIGLICTNANILEHFEKYGNDLFSTKDHHTYRDYILNGGGNIDDILYMSPTDDIIPENVNKFSKAYKHGNNTIEFIYGGVKIQLTSSNSTIIDLSKYNNYSVVLLCMSGNNPSHENAMELIVDETKSQMALVYYNGTQSDKAIYKETEYSNEPKNVDINNNALRLPLNKPLTSTKMASIDSVEVIAIPDDSGYYDNTIISPNSIIVASSPIAKDDSYTKEHFNVIFCKVNSSMPYDKNFENCILGKDIILVSDSKIINESNGEISTTLDKLNSISDMFMFTSDESLSIDKDTPKNSRIQPTFIELSKLAKIGNDIAIYVKSSDATRDYSGKNGIVSLSIIDALSTRREYSDFTYASLNTNVHPTYCNPVFKDVFKFNYSNNNINTIFETGFDGCNISLGDKHSSVNNIEQIWLRKYMANASENSKGLVDTDTTRRFTVNTGEVLFDIQQGELYINRDVNEIDNGTFEVQSVTTETSGRYQHILTFNDNGSFEGTNDDLPKKNNFIFYNDVSYNVTNCNLKVTDGGKLQGEIILVTTSQYTDNLYDVTNTSYITLNWNNNQFTLHSNGAKKNSEEFRIHNIVFKQPTSYTIPLKNGLFKHDKSNNTFTYSTYNTLKGSKSTKLNYTTTLSEIKNFSPLMSCFEINMFRTFINLDTYTTSNGIDTGYEKNTLFGSRGVQYKTGEPSNTITLTNWVKSEINKDKRKIRLNVTETLINFITFSPGFEKNWTSLTGAESFNKTMYIKNSMMKFINITSSCKFTLHSVKNSSKFDFVDYNKNMFNEISNVTNKLVYENDTYYIEIENLDERIYSATFTINI